MSLIWTYFTLCQDDPKHAVCNVHGTNYQVGGTFLTQRCQSCLRAFQAIYTNCWTPLNPRSVSQTSNVSLMSMLSLTAQWLDDEFELHQVLLHCEECPGSHTADNLTAKFEKMLAEWKIDKKRVHVVLRDNARNMTKALDDGNLPSLPCMAHTLQLAVSEGLQSQRTITDTVATGRRIATHFKHSSLAYSKLHTIQEELGQPTKRLQQDVPTRWNSTFYMLQSLLEQKRPLGLYATEHKLPAVLTTNQWGLIENVLSILEPFEELTKTISSSSATAAVVIPEITALKRLLGRAADIDRGVGTAKATLLEAVQRKFKEESTVRCGHCYGSQASYNLLLIMLISPLLFLNELAFATKL